ncbi:MAG: type II toxin-antitoxin system RelE/ParE family toxin [Akkermansiaceae bacterium]|nr:type II toxin-antitoxin system RelE/ParE family toxin [Akkermansiaceae bacterium]
MIWTQSASEDYLAAKDEIESSSIAFASSLDSALSLPANFLEMGSPVRYAGRLRRIPIGRYRHYWPLPRNHGIPNRGGGACGFATRSS